MTMGKYIRHTIGALVGALLGSLTSVLVAQGVDLDPARLDMLEVMLVDGLTLFVTIFGYAFTEKFLKRFSAIDPEGAADRAATKDLVRLRGHH
jgi:hypothetical protein